ncbi:MAG: DUF3857 domain-containing protein [Ferruginibacter sp.]
MAQSEVPAFGRLSISDMEMKDCTFDPGANAVKLIDQGNISFTRKPDEPALFTPMFQRRVRIKILTEAGLSYANTVIPFYSGNNEEKILKVDACLFNYQEDKKVRKTIVRSTSIYRKQVNKQSSELIILFPEAKVGSVIEYQYLLQSRLNADVGDWYFQNSLPTKFSELKIFIPAAFQIAIQPLTADSLEISEKEKSVQLISKGNLINTPGIEKQFIMRNLPGIRTEPFMNSAKDYLQRLSIRLGEIDYGNGNTVNAISDWRQVVKALSSDPDFGRQSTVSITDAANIIESAKLQPSPETRMAFIYDFVRKNFYWDGRQSIYSFDGVKNVFKKKTGSSGDINWLLLSLLRMAGIDAQPILFSTRANGLVNDLLPSTNQFNTVMALVEKEKPNADGEPYFILNATEKYAPYWLTPLTVINTKGFVPDGEEGRWINATQTQHKYKVATAVQAQVDTNGIIQGTVLITNMGYARKQRIDNWIENKDKFKDHYLTGTNKAILEGPKFEHLDADSLPLEEKYNFSLLSGNTGGNIFFYTNLFSGLSKNGFTSTQRHTDIDFGYQQEYLLFGNYTIPAGYEFEGLPHNVSLILPDTSIVFKRFITAENNSMNVKISVSFNRSYYTAAEYPEFAAFYKILIENLNEPVVIKKKYTP